jgi:hypothetical protein
MSKSKMSDVCRLLYALYLVERMRWRRCNGDVYIVMAEEDDVWFEDGMSVCARLVPPLAQFLKEYVI